MIKNLLLTVLCLVNFLGYSQTIGEAAWNYTEQTELNSFANQTETTICNSLVLTSICESGLTNIQANQTISVGCVYDLNGATITLPDNINFDYLGGDIINGTLIFSGGYIDGKLLNHTLTTSGDVTLKDTTFEFVASRWNIIEGEVTSDIAENNKQNFNHLLEILPGFYSDLNDNNRINFEINKLDAFFKVDGVNEWDIELATLGIRIPSNFNFKLSDNTYFRMYPNDNKKPTLIFIGEGVENITITGGKFIGDRDEHDYSDGENHEWGHILRVGGATNITITGAEFSDAMGDGIDVHAIGHSFDSNHIKTTEVYITGNTFYRNRRNQISITSGEYVYVENNTFIDASIHTDNSTGIAPGFAIDVEAFRSNGLEYEIAENIFIRNNIEKGSRIGSFTIHTGDLVTIENNDVENFMSYSNTYGSIIKNNTITSVNDNTANGGIAILAGRTDRYDLNYDNKIIGNSITGYGTGIVVTNVDITVAENSIIDCARGIVLEELKRAIIKDNIIKSTLETSTGISSGAAATFIDDVTITQTDPTITLIDVKRDPFKFVSINQNPGFENYTFSIIGTNSTSPATSTFVSDGIIFNDNVILEGGIRLANAGRISITENNITTTVANAIRIDAGCSDISITDNNLTTPLSCVLENNTDGVNITIDNNICNGEQ